MTTKFNFFFHAFQIHCVCVCVRLIFARVYFCCLIAIVFSGYLVFFLILVFSCRKFNVI